MNVLQAIESSGPGGAEKTLLHLCVGLRDRGHRVRALLLRPGWLREGLAHAGIETVVLSLSRPLDRTFLSELTDQIRTFGADVLHTHEFTYSIHGRLALRSTRAIQVATVHGDNFSGAPKRRIFSSVALRGRRLRLVCVSRELAVRTARRLARRVATISVVPNGIPMSAPPPMVPRRAGDPLGLVSVGNLYPVKNHALAIRAVGALVREGLDVNLEILGRGSEEARLRELIEAEGLEERVVLRGFQSDVVSHLDRAHALLSTSLHEGMPLSFLEAMSRRLPIVAPRVGGIPEMIEHGRHGLLFEPQNLEAAVAALRRLALDETLRSELAIAAERHVRDEFSVDRMLDRYERLFSERGGVR